MPVALRAHERIPLRMSDTARATWSTSETTWAYSMRVEPEDAEADAGRALDGAARGHEGEVAQLGVRVLVADQDADPVAGDAGVQDADEAPLLLERAEEGPHALEVLELRLGEDVRGAVEVDARLALGDGEGALAEGHHLLEERVVERLLLLHELEQARADLDERHAGEVGVQVVGAGLEVLGAEPLLDLDHLVGDDPGGRHHDHEDARVAEVHEVDVAEAGAGDVGGEDEAHVAAQPRQQVRGALHRLLGPRRRRSRARSRCARPRRGRGAGGP